MQTLSQIEDGHELLPVPSFRVSRYCPFEIKRYKLAQKGRALWTVVQCPNTCGVEGLRRMDVRHHVRFTCEMRRVICTKEGCKEIYPIKFREQHERFECAISEKRDTIISRALELNSPIVCELCSLPVRARALEKHHASECMFRKIECKYKDCAEEILARDEEDHYKFDCCSREIQIKYELIARARANRGWVHFVHSSIASYRLRIQNS